MAARKGSTPDDDDYWGSSSAQKIKKKGNLFGDEMNIDDVKNILRHNAFDEEADDEDDTINWDGSTPGKVGFAAKSARYRSEEPKPTMTSARPSVGGVPIGEAKPLATVSRPSTLSDPFPKPQQTRAAPTHTEVAKLEAEVNFLKRNLHVAKREKFVQIPPKEMVKRMVLGDNYSLEGYKALEEKISLLDEALKSHDGNVITTVVVFMKSSIKNTIFQRTLLQRPVAVEHYINYLRLRSNFSELENLLAMLNRHEEAAMIKYKQALASSATETKIRQLQACQRVHFTHLDQGLNFEAGMIQQQVSVLERQLPIENADTMEAKKNLPPFRDFPRVTSIVGKPVITTLYYCCIYHWGLSDNNLASPLAIRRAHGLSDAQYVWTAIRALVKTRRWNDIEALFHTKGWLGGTKMKAIVPFDRVVHLLHSLHAPRDIKNKFCNRIDDTRLKMETAQKFECHESLIEAYVYTKDRQALIAFQTKLKANSQEWFFARDALSNSSIKWKN